MDIFILDIWWDEMFIQAKGTSYLAFKNKKIF